VTHLGLGLREGSAAVLAAFADVVTPPGWSA
jgi:hypothetical protein